MFSVVDLGSQKKQHDATHKEKLVTILDAAKSVR